MFRFSTGFLSIALGAALVSAAGAQTAPNIPVPPKPDFSSMKFFLGTWNCESKSARRPTAAKSTVTSTMDPTGYWMTSVTKSPAVPWYQHDATSWDYVTYDSTTKRWIDMSYDDTGGYDFSQSEGWKGDTMIWKEVTYSKGADLASSADNTVTKVSDKLQKFESSFTTTAGKTVGVTGSCTKV